MSRLYVRVTICKDRVRRSGRRGKRFMFENCIYKTREVCLAPITASTATSAPAQRPYRDLRLSLTKVLLRISVEIPFLFFFFPRAFTLSLFITGSIPRVYDRDDE